VKHRIPTWLLERAALGEVPPERAEEVRDILASDPVERERLAELERSNAEILAELPPAEVAAEVARRAGTQRGGLPVVPVNGHAGRVRRRMMVLSSSFAAVAGVVLVVVAVGRQVGWPARGANGGGAGDGDIASIGDGIGADGDTRAKGATRLLLHRKLGDRVERLDARNDRVRAGDRIQISYAAGEARHGLILSIDGAGQVTLHYPASTASSTALVRAGIASLGHSYELDDAPGYERFLFLTSAGPIDVAQVVERAEALARDPQRAARDVLSLPTGQAQLWYTLRKEAAP
jgi:hypothetical protein